eukprot:TRINITY_DN5026_c0_g1_i1.p1 TRINITY_DN5026_c0_g1~~TRINITY_DN5026_c0_g1_i1.p1  ORF type:complete len:194 (+),score=31.27 TRINITY_DN5026_c0_g1_i1:97-678(+)
MKAVLLVVVFLAAVQALIPYHWELYKQCDSKWGRHPLGTSGRDTICSAGCAMSSVSMALASYEDDINKHRVDPLNLDEWLQSHGGYADGDLIIWDSVSKLGKLRTETITTSLSRTKMLDYIHRRQPIVVNVRDGSHWVLVIGYSESEEAVYYVNDPGFNSLTYTIQEMSHFVVYTNETRAAPIDGTLAVQLRK